MAVTKIKFPVSASALLILGLVLLSLQLMSSASQESSDLSQMYSWLLLVNSLGSFILVGLIGVNLYSLSRQLKKKEAGSRLTTRMLMLFVLQALAPAAIVFYFSVQFLNQGINSWFNVEIDRAMDDALELSQVSLDQRIRWHIKQTRVAADSLANKSETLTALEILAWRETLEAVELSVFSGQGRIIASSSINPSDILPQLPDEQVWLQIRQNNQFFSIDSTQEEMLIRVIVNVANDEPRFLQSLYSVPVRIADLADSIEFAYVRFQEMTFLRNSLKTSFSLTLSLVLLLSLLASIWLAFIIIRNIIAPVKALVKGTQSVAEGHYHQKLEVKSQDDLGFLVESFNMMTERISQSRDEAREASFEVESQKAYLETILGNLTAGVISFDSQYKIRTANQAAYRILHIPVSHFIEHDLTEVAHSHPDLEELLHQLQILLEQADEIWEERIAFLGVSGRQELLCRGTPLFSQSGGRMGAVVVFDDVTDLIQAQKNAAWGEVARRLAHEIKNPLTPIQLSAERLQLKLSAELSERSAEMLQRSSRTIIQQVEAMKRMVDDFTAYAKPSKKQVRQIELLELVQEVLHLYAMQGQAEIRLEHDKSVTLVDVDPDNIRQVLHNLIKNALEAMNYQGQIDISLKTVLRNSARFVEVGIYDQGTGLNHDQIQSIFEPYVTTKAKGTGLGLAIVKKIIEEHGGVIWVDTSYQQGAGFVFQLPAK